MATTPDLQEPQIAAARAKAWHQQSEPTDPLLTMEAVRSFVNEYGLVLFAPRPLGAPAPSLVEATLGTAKPSATPAESETARGLVARLTAEGSALPLNLLGGPGDLPDFVVSTAAFPFVFTLRGDKGWKRPPETSGAVKVTPLALRVYELLSERGAMTVADMVPEIGREVTDSAISRALGELWAMLRVIPALQQGAGETLWELTTARFAKAVKAGANAGQPTALSALISLYLGQAFIASEEEIASFLSPLTARSRVRDVLHGLTAGRQLNEAVLEGKAVLYIPDALPDFAQIGAETDTEPDAGLAEGADEPTDATAAFDAALEGGNPDGNEGRIQRFAANGGTPSRGKPAHGKPAAREGGFRPGTAPGFRSGPRPSTPRGPRPEGDRPRSPGGYKGAADRPYRPERPEFPKRSFDRDAPRPRPTGDRPSFTRPWDEARGSRPGGERNEGRPARPRREGEDSRPPRREGGEGRPFRPARPHDESRPPRREGGSDRPPFRREGGSDRPPFRREGGSDRPPFRREGGSDRPPFRREGGSDRPPFRREGGSDRPPFRREGGSDRPSFGDRPRSPRPPSDRPYTPRPYPKREGSFEGRPPRREGDRPSFDRPSFDRPRPGAGSRSEGGPSRGPGGRPPFRGGSAEGRGPGRPAGGSSFRPRPGGAPGGFSRGPKRDASGKGGPRGAAGGPSRDRPAPRRRPEDEA